MNMIPYHIYKNFRERNYTGMFKGGVLFVDISKFTSLSERMMDYGKEGAEYLSRILNDSIFSQLINIVYEYNGFISTFAGDAFTAIFMDIGKGMDCFNIIKNNYNSFEVKTPWGKEILKLKGGFSYGEIEWGIIGKEKYFSYYYRGYPVDRSAELEKYCKAGDFLIDDKLDYSNLSSTQFYDKSIRSNRYVNYFCKGLPFDYGGEFRNVVSMFIFLPSHFYDCNRLSEFVYYTRYSLDIYKGFMNLLEFGDKGLKVFAVWGAPVSYENNILNALKFAVDITGEYPELKIGISYGKSFAGIIGSKRRYTYTVIGDRVNTTARLGYSASSGKILVSNEIYNRVKDKVGFDYVGEVELKGKTERKRVWQLKGIYKQRDEMSPDTPFVGRKKEIERIKKVLDERINKASNLGMFIIKGGMGYGKTALVKEVQNIYNNSIEFVVVDGREFNGERLLREIAIKIFDEHTQSGDFDKRWEEFTGIIKRDELLFAYPFIKYIVTGFMDNTIKHADATNLKSSIHSAIKEMIKGVSILTGGIMIFIDNLNGEDNELWEWMHEVFKGSDNFPFGFIIATRDKDVKFENDITAYILLRELDDEDVVKLIHHYFKKDMDKIEKIIKNKCGNVPFCIIEYISYLKEIYEKDGLINDYEIPSTVEDLILAQIDKMSADCKDFLKYASVAGYDFRMSVMESLFGEKTDQIIKEKGISDLLVKKDEEKYSFKQSFIRDVICGVMISDDIKRLHWTIGNIMRKIYSKNESLFYEIGNHYYESDKWNTAKMFYKKALKYAEHNYYVNESFEICDRLIEIDKNHREKYYMNKANMLFNLSMWNVLREKEEEFLSVFRGRNRIRFKLMLAYMYVKLGKYDVSERIIKDVEKHISYDTKEYNTLCIVKGMINMDRGNFKESEKWFTISYNYAKRHNDDKLKSIAMNNISLVLWDKNDLDGAIDHFIKTLEIAKRSNDKYTMVSALNNLGGLMFLKNRVDESLRFYGKAIKISQEIMSMQTEAIIYGNMGHCYYKKGEYDRAIDHYLMRLRRAEELGDIRGKLYAKNNIGSVYYVIGDKRRAYSIYKELWEKARDINLFYIEKVSLVNLTNITFDMGLLSDSLFYAEKIIELRKSSDNRELEVIGCVKKKRIFLYMGQYNDVLNMQCVNRSNNDLERVCLEDAIYSNIARFIINSRVKVNVEELSFYENMPSDLFFYFMVLLRLIGQNYYSRFNDIISNDNIYSPIIKWVINGSIDKIKEEYKKCSDVKKRCEYGIELVISGEKVSGIKKLIKEAAKNDYKYTIYIHILDILKERRKQ